MSHWVNFLTAFFYPLELKISISKCFLSLLSVAFALYGSHSNDLPEVPEECITQSTFLNPFMPYFLLVFSGSSFS
jgi:hypothetical protein